MLLSIFVAMNLDTSFMITSERVRLDTKPGVYSRSSKYAQRNECTLRKSY